MGAELKAAVKFPRLAIVVLCLLGASGFVVAVGCGGNAEVGDDAGVSTTDDADAPYLHDVAQDVDLPE